MKLNKKHVKQGIIILIALAIVFGIFHYFNVIFKVEGEAKPVDLILPAETQELTISIDSIKPSKIEWKDALLIKGWVFRQNVKEKKRELYLVFKSANDNLIFKVEKCNILRPDVTSYYHLDEACRNHGFEIQIPMYLLKETTYQVGFVIGDETGQHFTLSTKKIVISGGEVELKNSASEIKQVSITLKPATDKIKNSFETIKTSNNNLMISGWGFLQGLNADSLISYVLLKKNEKVTVFSIVVQPRQDVTIFFKELALNLDKSGFIAQIGTETLEKGHYEVGLYILRGNRAGISYSGKYVDIGK